MKRRVQFDLPENSVRRLDELKKKTEATSYAEVAKESFSLYERIIKAIDDGYRVVLEKENERVELTFLH